MNEAREQTKRTPEYHTGTSPRAGLSTIPDSKEARGAEHRGGVVGWGGCREARGAGRPLGEDELVS